MGQFADKLWATRVLAKPGALMARMDGRAFWVARYQARDDVYEWQVDWSNLPRKGLTELVLVCPTGQVGVLGNLDGKDMAGRFFQLKIGAISSGGDREQLAHVIGRLDGTNGECTIYAWEPPYVTQWKEQYQEPANDGGGGIVWRERTRREPHPGRFVGPLQDNFFAMRYQGNAMTGLYQDVLGVKAD